jgi:transcription termination factor NusB
MVEKIEQEVKEAFDENFINRVKRLKKTWNIFNPIFYLVFTRLVEVSSIINDVVFPSDDDVKEMFRTRVEFLQLDYQTINETLRNIWVFELRRGEGYKFSQSVEELMYVVHRMKDIQAKIDQIILNSLTRWSKEDLLNVYFAILKTLLEVEEEVSREVEREIRYETLGKVAASMNLDDVLEALYNLVLEYPEEKRVLAIRLLESESLEMPREIDEIFSALPKFQKQFIISSIRSIFQA